MSDVPATIDAARDRVNAVGGCCWPPLEDQVPDGGAAHRIIEESRHSAGD